MSLYNKTNKITYWTLNKTEFIDIGCFCFLFIILCRICKIYFTCAVRQLIFYFLCIFFKDNLWGLSNVSFSLYNFRFIPFHTTVPFVTSLEFFIRILKFLCFFSFLAVTFEGEECIKHLVIYYLFRNIAFYIALYFWKRYIANIS